MPPGAWTRREQKKPEEEAPAAVPLGEFHSSFSADMEEEASAAEEERAGLMNP